MAADLKLRAEMFWIDRWYSSSAQYLPHEPKGMLRETFTLAWSLGASLPNDPEWIKRALRSTDDEWARCWPIVRDYWHVNGDGRLVNDTQVEVYAKSRQSRERLSRVSRHRWPAHAGAAHAGAASSRDADRSDQIRSDQIRSEAATNVADHPYQDARARENATRSRHRPVENSNGRSRKTAAQARKQGAKRR